MADASLRGRFVWHELMTTDTKAAVAFYSKMVGWKPQAWDQDATYTLLATGKARMAGIMALPDGGKAMGGRPSWMSYIGTPNVDETARQAASLGGRILNPPADIPTIGRFAVLADPQGAVFNAFTPLPRPGPTAPAATLGDFSWHELATTDPGPAFSFYKSLFGWEETSTMDMGPELGSYQMFGFDGKPLGGIFKKPAQMPGPSNWLPYIHTPDAKKTAEALKKLGGQVINGPMEVPGGDWIVQGLDPQGGMFAIHSLKPAPAKAARKAVKKKAKPARKAARKAARKGKAAKKTARRPVKKAARKTSRKASRKKAASRRRR